MNTFCLFRYLLACSMLLYTYSAQADHLMQSYDILSAAQPLSATSSGALSMADAMQLATKQQPLLESLEDAAAATRQAAVAQGQLPDPKLKLGVSNLPVTSNDALRFNRDDMTMTTIGLSQEVVPKARREASSHIMEAEADQFHFEQLATARSIEREVALAWLDVFEAQRKSVLYQKIAEEMEAEHKVASASISSGGSQLSDVLRLDTQLAMMNDKRLTSRRDEQKARAMLSRWIGIAANKPLTSELPDIAASLPSNFIVATSLLQSTSAGSVLDDVALTQHPSEYSVLPDQNIATAELEQHPMLQNARQLESVAQLEADHAQTHREQNWSWEVMYGKRREDLSDMVTFQVAFDLPWDRANRQDRRIAEKQLLVEKASKQTEDRRRQLSAELTSAEADWETAEAREVEHQQRLIPHADARLQVVQAGYAAGKGSLADVWEARRGVLEVEVEHWGILVDRQRAAVNLGYLLNNHSLAKGN